MIVTLNAAARLHAAKADEAKAMAYVKSLGFKIMPTSNPYQRRSEDGYISIRVERPQDLPALLEKVSKKLGVTYTKSFLPQLYIQWVLSDTRSVAYYGGPTPYVSLYDRGAL